MKNANDIKAIARHIRYEADGQKFICTDPKQGKLFNTDLKKKRAHGYYAVRLSLTKNDRTEVYCHHLLWYLHYGEVPKHQVRFLGSKEDLRIENLVCRDGLNYDKPKTEYARIVVKKDDLERAMSLLKANGFFDDGETKPMLEAKQEPEPSPVETSAMPLFPIDCYFLDWAYN